VNGNAQQGLFQQLSVLVGPLRAAAQSEYVLRSMALSVGWDLDEITGLPVGDLQARLNELINGVETLSAFLEKPPQTLSELRASLDAAKQVFGAIRNISSILDEGAQPSQFKEFGRDLISAMTVAHLQGASPLLYHLAVLFTVIEPANNQSLSEPVFDSAGKLVRVPHSRPELRLSRVVDLIKSPEDVLETEYLGPGGLETAADARRAADKLFPRLGAVLAALGANVAYGFKPGYGIDLGDPDNLAGGMLTAWIEPQGVDSEAGATLSLSPAEQGDLGLVVSPFGSVEFTQLFESWALSANLTAGVDAFALGPNGFRLLLGEGGSGDRVSARLELSRQVEAEGSVTRVGSTTGTRLEAKTLRILAEANLQPAEQEYGLLAEVGEAVLVVVPGDGDGFLKEILPADGLRVNFDMALGWSNRLGLHFRGSGGLEAEFPLHLSIGPIAIDSIHLAIRAEADGIRNELAATAGVQLGPVNAVVDQIGLAATLTFPEEGGNLGVADLDLRFKPPTGAGLVIDAAVVVGGGYLFFDAQKEEYGGILQLEIAETIAVKAIGLLTTRMPDGSKGFSLVVIIAAEGFPPIQLGFGFTLTGIGGLLGINRTVMVDVLRSGLKNGTLGSILFPDDPIRNAPQIVSDLRAVFPPVKDRYVFGPMAIIGWGTPAILTLEIGLILELPEPVRLIILGRLRAVLPDEDHALVHVRMDAIGVIDFNKGEVSLDATLYDSRILAFVLTGDMALRANWGAQPNFILAIGGFNPRFPAPAGFPQLARLALSLGDSDNPRLRFESYLALTSNTVQFGARLDFSYSAAGFTLAGFLGFDALFQFSPFEFIADVGAMVALKRGGSVLMGVFLDITLAGPTPWHVWGEATFKVLIFKVSIRFDHRFGREEPPSLPEPIDVLALLVEALSDRRNWSSALPRGEHPIVSLRDSVTTQTQPVLRVHPLAELAVRQRVVPLNRPLTKFGNAPLAGGITSFTLAASRIDNTPLPMPSTMVRDAFALAQYQEMSDEEKLARPAFETQDAGLQFGVEEAAYQYEALTDTAISYETLIIDPTRPPEKVTEPYVLPQPVLDAVVGLGAAGQALIRRSGSSRYRALALAA
jgi:hypothetical protein